MATTAPSLSGADHWLPALVRFSDFGGNWSAYEDALFGFFRADFIDSKPSLPGRRWAVKRHPESRGKPSTFWHCISAGKSEEDRLPDMSRCERIRWPRPMIDAYASGPVRCWRTTRGTANRIAIATHDFSYLIVLEDRRKYIMLWTSYCVEGNNKRRDLRREYERFEAAVRAGEATLF